MKGGTPYDKEIVIQRMKEKDMMDQGIERKSQSVQRYDETKPRKDKRWEEEYIYIYIRKRRGITHGWWRCGAVLSLDRL